MIFAAAPWVERIALLFGLSGDQLADLIWAILVIGMVFASLHLITMLVTRWGDSNALYKSLIFSILVHLSCGIGLGTLRSDIRAFPVSTEKKAPEEQKIELKAEESVAATRSGNTPVWEELPRSETKPFSRLEEFPVETAALTSPDRVMDPVPFSSRDFPDLPTFPDEPTAVPEPHRIAPRGMRVDSTAPIPSESPLAEARDEVRIAAPTLKRSDAIRGIESRDEASPERELMLGAIDRLSPEFDPSRHLDSLDRPTQPEADLVRGPEREKIIRRQGPSPSPRESEDIGLDQPERVLSSEAGSPFPPKLERTETRTPDDRRSVAMERLDPNRTPRDDSSEVERELAVRDSLPIDIPRHNVGRPNVVRPQSSAIRQDKSASVPATYRLRMQQNRLEAARRFGGTEKSEEAVEASLKWLAAQQDSKGFWDANQFGSGQIRFDEQGVDRQFAGRNADSGVTALAMLAFLGAGYTHEEGQYADVVDRALSWLIDQQATNGYLGGNAVHHAKMYCHGMATYAMAEAYAMQSDLTTDTRLREPLRKAVLYIVSQQNPSDGGWRYVKGQKSDMSIFGWQLMALKSAELAGIEIPEIAKIRMKKFLQDRSLGENKGLAGYRVDSSATEVMTAEALFCKQMIGLADRDDAASQEAVEYILSHPPTLEEYNLYYWYYGTLSMFQYGGPSWREWNESTREILTAHQRSAGDLAGSWDPVGPWGPYGGRIYSTALATLCLEVYYRLLPLYQSGGLYE